MNLRNDILNFLLEKKIPLQVAIEILQQEEKKLKQSWKAQEKAVLPKYETR